MHEHHEIAKYHVYRSHFLTIVTVSDKLYCGNVLRRSHYHDVWHTYPCYFRHRKGRL